jgi:pimeloyl-ACP methyl ester carboxylesterase
MAISSASQFTLAGFPAIQAGSPSERPPLLFVHGAFVDHVSFGPWLEFFAARGWHCVAAARRGRAGLGPERASGLSIADYVEDTVKIVDALGQTPIVVGHSLGGLIAQKLAELGKARGLVLLAPAPAKALPAQPVALPAYLPMMPRIIAGRPIRPSAKGCSTIALNRMPAEACPALHATLVHESGKVYREMIFGSFKVDFSKIHCPAMVVGGREDRIVAPAIVDWTAAKLGVTSTILEGHAHWLLEEAGWQKIAGQVAAFLDSIGVDKIAALRRSA